MLAGACQMDDGPLPSLDQLRQPTGLAVDAIRPALFVTNGNWDRQQVDSTLMAIDLDALYTELARPGEAGDRSRPCRRVAPDDPTIECEPSAFIDDWATVRLGTGAGNIAIDQPTGTEGLLRLMVPTRSPNSVTWVDVQSGPDGVVLDCDQGEDSRCGSSHEIRLSTNGGERLPGEPARLTIDDQGARFGYLPHLLGGSLSLLALDGARGPELADVEGEFFREDVFEDDDLRGGFAVASRPCDPEAPPSPSRDCERPFMYASHRYFPGVRHFTVAPGLDLLLPGREVPMPVINPQVVLGRPFLGDIAFEDPTVGDRLLVVQTTPPGLVRLDTSLDEDNLPRDEAMSVVTLCDNPNVLTVYRPPEAEALALITCAGEGRLAIVGLGSFRLLASVPVGVGAYEVVVDHERQQAYVSNPGEDTISIVDVGPRSPLRFIEWARVGTRAGSRVP